MITPRDTCDPRTRGPIARRRSSNGFRHDPEAGGPPRARARTRPVLELLEYRMLLTNFFVNSNADTNTGTNATTGTLRYVLNQLNSTVGGASNVISFADLHSSEFTFTPATPLPTVNAPVTIDGTTAPGFSSAPLITIAEVPARNGHFGLTLGSGSSGSMVKGLAIGGFPSADVGILSGSTGDDVAGCWLGIKVGNGTRIIPNEEGIFVEGTGATIGGTASGDANTISGNSHYGIDIEAPSCTVVGNLIGTNSAGATVANGTGVFVHATGATIGGTAPDDPNTISGNSLGIDIEATSCTVVGNLIGTNSAGATVANGTGIFVGAGATGATIGGAATGAGNVIAFNGGPGVAVEGGVTGTTIRFNSIHDNAGPGIDLGDDGVTPNTFQSPNNTPVLGPIAGNVLSGTLNAKPAATYVIDFYANPMADATALRPQGRTYLGTTTVTTDTQGNATFGFALSPDSFEPSVTATATDASGTTSEFSAPLTYPVPAGGQTIAATAGVPFSGQVAAFTSLDPSAVPSDFTAAIDWGDGTSATAGTVAASPGGFVVVGSHSFTTADPAEPVTITITDMRDGLQSTIRSLADVAGPSGVLTTYGQTANFVAGTLYSATLVSFTDSNPNAVAGQFTAVITWGDGTTGPGTVSASGAGFIVSGTHTYNYASEPGVSVVITDHLTGLTATAAPTVVVAPVAITISPKNFAVTPGTAFSGAVATFTDANPLTSPGFYTATINWGDGTPNTTVTPTGTNPFTVTGSHTYATTAFNSTNQWTLIVTITITDLIDGRTATAVARAVDPPGASTNPTVPGSVASPAPVVPTSPTVAPVTATPAPAASPVSLTMSTEDLILSPNGTFHGIVASFADGGSPEPASDYRATINWGKGRRSAGMITGSNGRFIVSGRHVFPRFSGTKTVTVTVTDAADGQSVSASESVSEAFHDRKVVRETGPGKDGAASHR